jgi:2-oxo-4-hydroxy-4-carboxy-5-ureidoimidazoline decarboxylase
MICDPLRDIERPWLTTLSLNSSGGLAHPGRKIVSDVLTRWNHLPADEAAHEILPCCGSTAWAQRMAARRPLADDVTLLAASDETWRGLDDTAWDEAFRSHPRIGETRSAQPSHARSAAWSALEQQKAALAGDDVKIALAERNTEYERRFNRIFIVCASGKTAPEILDILRRRLQNDPDVELREAVEQQRQIMHLRIKRWLGE